MKVSDGKLFFGGCVASTRGHGTVTYKIISLCNAENYQDIKVYISGQNSGYNGFSTPEMKAKLDGIKNKLIELEGKDVYFGAIPNLREICDMLRNILNESYKMSYDPNWKYEGESCCVSVECRIKVEPALVVTIDGERVPISMFLDECDLHIDTDEICENVKSQYFNNVRSILDRFAKKD